MLLSEIKCVQGMKESKLYMANGVALLVSWSVVRVGLFGWLFRHLYDRR